MQSAQEFGCSFKGRMAEFVAFASKNSPKVKMDIYDRVNVEYKAVDRRLEIATAFDHETARIGQI